MFPAAITSHVSIKVLVEPLFKSLMTHVFTLNVVFSLFSTDIKRSRVLSNISSTQTPDAFEGPLLVTFTVNLMMSDTLTIPDTFAFLVITTSTSFKAVTVT